jgi:hypothetical protein
MADEIQNPDAPVAVGPKPDDAPPILTPSAARFDSTDWRSFAIAAALAFAGYGFTLSPDVTLEWSGMLSAGAYYGGGNAPPGYPVWTLYASLFAHLIPISNVAWRIAVGSAVASAAACGVAALMVSYGGRCVLGGTATFSQLSQRQQSWLREVAGCAAGLVLGFSGSVWDQAVIVETKGLGLLLFAAMLGLLMRWFFEPSRKRYVCGAFLVFGLLLTNNQELVVVLPGLVGAAMLADMRTGRDLSLLVLPLGALGTCLNQYGAWTQFPARINWPLLAEFLAVALIGLVFVAITRRILTEWKCALGCGLGLLFGLAFYFYLPVASMTTPPVNWAYPRTVEGFVHLISRGQYERVRPTDNVSAFLGQVGAATGITGKQFGWLYLVMAALPFACLRRFNPVGRRWLFVLLAVFLCTHLMVLVVLNPPLDRGSLELLALYFAPSYVILAVCFGLGLILIGARMIRPPETTGG